jgi:hypothetical protein
VVACSKNALLNVKICGTYVTTDLKEPLLVHPYKSSLTQNPVIQMVYIIEIEIMSPFGFQCA